MKGEHSNCGYCGKVIIKKRDNHKYCRTSCRVSANRKKKGIPEPDFLTKGVNKPLQARPTELIASNSVQIRTPDTALLIAQQQLNYYEQIISDAGANVFPLYTVGGAGAGALYGKTGLEKLTYGLVGGLIGNQFDASRKERIIRTAQENVKIWRAEIRNIKAAQTFAKIGIQKGTVEEKRKGIIQVITTDSYKEKNIPSLGLNRNTQWHYLIGDPSTNFMAMLHGMPGNGKSTFSIQLADYFQKNHGDVLYIASEQKGLNRSFQDLLNQYDVNSNFDISNNPKDHNYKSILKASKDYKLVIIDSINHIGLTVEQFEEIRDKNSKTAFLAIMQSAKDGNFKGSQEWAHNCDIIIEMKSMVAYQTKSRYAPPANIKIIR